MVIKNYIKYKDMHNIDKLRRCVTYKISDGFIEDIKKYRKYGPNRYGISE